MGIKGVGRGESIFDIGEAVIKNEPGSSYSVDGEAFVILEDGSMSALRDASYRDFMSMMSSNKIVLKNVTETDANPFSPNLLQDSSYSSDAEFYSVHDIITEVEYDDVGLKTLTKKRISFTTFAKDVVTEDKWRTQVNTSAKTKYSAEELINKLMTSSFVLDDYFDKTKSSTALLDNNGVSLGRIIFRLRKMDNPVSEVDASKFVNVLMTGKAALEILAKLKTNITALKMYAMIKIENSYTDGTIDTMYVNFESNNDILNFVFDSYNSDTTATVDDETNIINFKHRNFGVVTSSNAQEEETIYMTKAIVMNSNGHLSYITKTNVESTKEINKLYYTKAQMDSTVINKFDTGIHVMSGSLSTDNLTVESDALIEGDVITSGKTIVYNSTNTSVKDPLVVIGSDNDGTAENVGSVYNVYKAEEVWDENMLTEATFSMFGGVAGITSDVLSVVLTKDTVTAYTPADYVEDTLLSTDYHIAEAFFDLKASKINMFLASSTTDQIKKISQLSPTTKLRLFSNNLLNATSSDLSIQAFVECKRRHKATYDVINNFSIPYQSSKLFAVESTNTYDVDKVRLRIRFLLSKSFVASLTKNITFNVQKMLLCTTDALGNILEESKAPSKATRYYSDPSSLKFDSIRITNGAGDPREYSNFKGSILADGNTTINSDTVITYNNLETQAATFSIAMGDSYFTEPGTLVKMLHIKSEFTPTYTSDTTDETKETRESISIEPSMKNYTVKMEVYAAMYSDLISSLGAITTTTDVFGKSTSSATSTVMNFLDDQNGTLVNTSFIPITQYFTYGTIDEYVDVDLSTFAPRMANDVEYFTGKFKKDCIHLFAKLYLIKTPEDDRYNSYEDYMIITNLEINAHDILQEDRSTARDVLIDSSMYDDLDEMFLSSDWDTTKNELTASTTLGSNGVNSVELDTEGLPTLSVSKSAGSNYSTFGWTDPTDDIDQRTYMVSFRFKKSTSNLIKTIISLKDIITNNVSMTNFSSTKLYSMLFTVNDDATYTALETYTSSPLVNGEDIADFDLLPSTIILGGTKAISEMKRVAKLTTTLKEAYMDTMTPNTTYINYYDVNELDDGITLELCIFLDVPVSSLETIQTLLIKFDKLCVKLLTNLEYKMRYTDALSASQAILYNKTKNAIRFVENKFSTDNEALNISHLTDFEVNKLYGAVEKVIGLTNKLTLSFTNQVVGSLDINEDNASIKKVATTADVTSEEQQGLIGIIKALDMTIVSTTDLPEISTYNAPAMYKIVDFLEMLKYRKENGILNSSSIHLATSYAVTQMYSYLMSVLSRIQQVWIAESAARKLASTVTVDLLSADKEELFDAARTVYNGINGAANGSIVQVTPKYLRLTINGVAHDIPTANFVFGKFGHYHNGGWDTRALVTEYEWLPYAVSYAGNYWTGYIMINTSIASLGDLSSYPNYRAHLIFDDYFRPSTFVHLGGDNWWLYDYGRFSGVHASIPHVENTYLDYYTVASQVIFDSGISQIGSLHSIWFPISLTTTTFVEYSGQTSYPRTLLNYMSDINMSYRRPDHGGWDIYNYTHNNSSGGGGYYAIYFSSVPFTRIEQYLQYSADDGATWHTMSSHSFIVGGTSSKTVTGEEIACNKNYRYRILKNVSHRRVDMDNDVAPDGTRGARLIGCMARTIWFPMGRWDDVGGDAYYAGRNQAKRSYSIPYYWYRSGTLKYIKYYNEPWLDETEFAAFGYHSVPSLNMYHVLQYEFNSKSHRTHSTDYDHAGYYPIGSTDAVSIILASDASGYMKRNYNLYSSGYSVIKFSDHHTMYMMEDHGIGRFGYAYMMMSGSYWLSDTFFRVPAGVSKICLLFPQTLSNIMYVYADRSDTASSIKIEISLKMFSSPQSSNQDVAVGGTTLYAWNWVLNNTRSLSINSSDVPEVGKDLTIDPSKYYYYYIRYGKNGATTRGVDLNSFPGVVKKWSDGWNSWGQNYNHQLTGFNFKYKYYVYK